MDNENENEFYVHLEKDVRGAVKRATDDPIEAATYKSEIMAIWIWAQRLRDEVERGERMAQDRRAA